MTPQSELINLYNILKGEINDLGASNSRLLLSLVASTGTILTLGLTQKPSSERPLFFLSVYFFIIPLSAIIYGNRKEIWKTSTYMRVFLEPLLLETKWETRLYSLMERLTDKERRTHLTSIIRSESWLLIGLNFATLSAIIISFFQVPVEENGQFEILYTIIALGISSSILIFFVISVFRLNSSVKRGGKVEDWYFKSWSRLKSVEIAEKSHEASEIENNNSDE